MEEAAGISIFQSGALNIDNALQNQEEDEDLEEQKRRQEEIQNFLTNAMDEFNYDESTINSTNVSIEQSHPQPDTLAEKYKRANFDDQLKVLYEVRVREVKELSQKLENLQAETEKQNNINARKCILLEADKEKAQISLKQCQDLLVCKNEEISSLGEEVEHLRCAVSTLEKQLNSLNDEYISSKEANKSLLDQLTIMHNGLTTNTISDRQIQEKHHSEISQLHHLLDIANTKLFRKEKECKEYEEKFKDALQQKDVVVTEKCSVINKLTENLETAQEQCQELLGIIDKLSNENKTMKLSNTTELQDSSRMMGIAEKMEYINALQKELAKAHEKYMRQQNEYENVQKHCAALTENCNRIEEEKREYKIEIEQWRENYEELQENFKKADEQISSVQQQIESYRGELEKQKKQYEEKIFQLQSALSSYENRKTEEAAAQVSMTIEESKIDNEETEKVRDELAQAQREVEFLNIRLLEAEDQVAKFQVAAKLEKEREGLIKTLQDKAAQFEKIIKERQQKPECLSIGVNTDQVKDNEDLLKAEHEADLVQKEIELRVELKNDFDQRLEKIEQELAKKLLHRDDKKCTNCDELTNKLKKLEHVTYNKDEQITSLKVQMKQDRLSIATILESWREKFMDMEIEKKEMTAANLEMRNYCNELTIKLQSQEVKLKSQDVGTLKLYEIIKKECEETKKLWNRNMVESLAKYTEAQKRNVTETQKRIEKASDYADAQVQAIEMQFLRKKQSLEKFRFSPH